MKVSEYVELLKTFPQDLEVAGFKYSNYSQTPNISVKTLPVDANGKIDYADEVEEKDFLEIDWMSQ